MSTHSHSCIILVLLLKVLYMKRRTSSRSTAVCSNAALQRCLKELDDANDSERRTSFLSEKKDADDDYSVATKRRKKSIVPELPREISSDTTFEQHGYRVFRSGVRIGPKLRKLKSDVMQRKGAGAPSAIFNGIENNDNLRLQAPLDLEIDVHLPGLQTIISSLPELSETELSPWRLIISKDGCAPQVAHTDWVPQETSSKSFACVVALQPNTTLDIWPGAHAVLSESLQEGGGYLARSRLLAIARSQICLDAGDVLLFRSDLVHAGSAYAKRNVRLHAYFDHPCVRRVEGRVWKVFDHVF